MSAKTCWPLAMFLCLQLAPLASAEPELEFESFQRTTSSPLSKQTTVLVDADGEVFVSEHYPGSHTVTAHARLDADTDEALIGLRRALAAADYLSLPTELVSPAQTGLPLPAGHAGGSGPTTVYELRDVQTGASHEVRGRVAKAPPELRDRLRRIDEASSAVVARAKAMTTPPYFSSITLHRRYAQQSEAGLIEWALIVAVASDGEVRLAAHQKGGAPLVPPTSLRATPEQVSQLNRALEEAQLWHLLLEPVAVPQQDFHLSLESAPLQQRRVIVGDMSALGKMKGPLERVFEAVDTILATHIQEIGEAEAAQAKRNGGLVDGLKIERD